MKKKLLHILQKHHEWITIPFQIVIFIIVWRGVVGSGLTVRDPGILQKLLIAILFFTTVLAGVRVAKKLYFPALFRYVDEDSKENKQWEGLTKYQVCLLGVIVFVGLAITFALCFQAA